MDVRYRFVMYKENPSLNEDNCFEKAISNSDDFLLKKFSFDFSKMMERGDPSLSMYNMLGIDAIIDGVLKL